MGLFSFLKERWFRKNKLSSNDFSVEDKEVPTYEHSWSLTGHRVFGDIYCTKCFLPKPFADFKEHSTCKYEK